jgi:HTH-type transcriptional regulator / antitoxin HipB
MPLQRRSRADAAEIARERGGLAAVINARRQELGLSQVELGDLAGVSYRIVHNLEVGRVEVSLERLLAVLRTLGLHLLVERGATEHVIAGPSVSRQYGLPAPQ